MLETSRGDETSAPPRSGIGLREYTILVGVGAFVTTFAQSRVLGQFPTTFLLKEQLHLGKEQVALFFFWVTFPWNLKPLVGILTDAFPIFGTRRRHYMLIGAAGAAVCWASVILFTHAYGLLLSSTLAYNIAIVLASTVMGGLMVEAGHAFGASGRITAVRQFTMNMSYIGGPLLGGYLAERAYGWTVGVAAASCLGLAACAYAILRERPAPPRIERARAVAQRIRPPRVMTVALVGAIVLGVALYPFPDFANIAYSLFALVFMFGTIIAIAVMRTTNPVIANAQMQLGQILYSGTLWLAAGMTFLVWTVPGFNTALIYQQSDVLHLDKTFIGFLGAVEGVFGVAMALVYPFLCRRWPLRRLIVVAVGVNASATLLYLRYTPTTAPFIHALVGTSGGACLAFMELSLMDLAVRSTPRGCEALGFALMMSVRNFAIALNDVLGSQLMDRYHVSFTSLILTNALTTMAVLVCAPLLPGAIVDRREGERS